MAFQFIGCLLVFFCNLMAHESLEPCLSTKQHGFLNITINRQSNPLTVNSFIEVTASITKDRFIAILNEYENPPSFEDIEPCFFLQHEGGLVFSGGAEGNCDFFNSKGKAEKTWVLETTRPGTNKLNISLAWKYIDDSESHPICPSETREVFVVISTHWIIDSILDNWDKISVMFLTLATLITSICALQNKQSKIFLWTIIGLFLILFAGLAFYWIYR